MPITFETISQALNFLDGFDGYGMVGTDEELQVMRLRDFDLTDDYEPDVDDDGEYQCGSCDKFFAAPVESDEFADCCPHCGSGNFVKGAVDDFADDTGDAGCADEPAAVVQRKSFADICTDKTAELMAFAARELETNPARGDEDFWSAFDSRIDVQFWICDDEQNANFNRREIWAYEIVHDADGNRGETKIDTANGVLIAVI